MIKITEREAELERQINIYQANALRSINGVLIGLEMGIEYMDIHLHSDCPSLKRIKDLLFKAKATLQNFKLEIAEDFSTLSIKYDLETLSNCSERDLIYGLGSFERNVSLCFERLKIESPKHEQLCTSAQKEINRIIKYYINS